MEQVHIGYDRNDEAVLIDKDTFIRDMLEFSRQSFLAEGIDIPFEKEHFDKWKYYYSDEDS